MTPSELPQGVLIFAAIGWITTFAAAWWFCTTILTDLIDRWLPGIWDAVDDDLVPTPRTNEPPGA